MQREHPDWSREKCEAEAKTQFVSCTIDPCRVVPKIPSDGRVGRRRPRRIGSCRFWRQSSRWPLDAIGATSQGPRSATRTGPARGAPMARCCAAVNSDAFSICVLSVSLTQEVSLIQMTIRRPALRCVRSRRSSAPCRRPRRGSSRPCTPCPPALQARPGSARAAWRRSRTAQSLRTCKGRHFTRPRSSSTRTARWNAAAAACRTAPSPRPTPPVATTRPSRIDRSRPIGRGSSLWSGRRSARRTTLCRSFPTYGPSARAARATRTSPRHSPTTGRNMSRTR